MYEEYKIFVEKRLEYFVAGDADTPTQTHYTVLIENLPKELRTAKDLGDFMDEVFPGK
jgi:hypothetical protein